MSILIFMTIIITFTGVVVAIGFFSCVFYVIADNDTICCCHCGCGK